MRFPSRPARSVFPLLLSLAARFGVLLPVMVLFIVLVPRVARAQEGPLDKSEPKAVSYTHLLPR